MDNIKLTFPANNDAELLVTVGNNVSISVYEGKTASFDKKDFDTIFNTIKNISHLNEV